jgi:hypothetical protein
MACRLVRLQAGDFAASGIPDGTTGLTLPTGQIRLCSADW